MVKKFQSLFGNPDIHSSKFEPQSHQSLPRKLHVRSRQPVKKEVRFPHFQRIFEYCSIIKQSKISKSNFCHSRFSKLQSNLDFIDIF